ncbi:MAG: hypothetical protein ACOYL6_09670 [Bacteriovoracaceae bacterium]
MKKLLAFGLLSATLLTTSIGSYARCQDQYLNKIEYNKTFADKFCGKMNNCALGALTLGYFGSFLIVGFASTPLVMAPTVVLVADDYIEDLMHDNYYKNIIRLTNYAEYVAGTMPIPNANIVSGYEATVLVPDDGKDAKKAKKINQKVRDANLELVKIHAQIRKELSKSEKTFVKLYNQLSEDIPGVTIKEMANIITEANNQDLLCNGIIGAYDEDVSMRDDYVIVDGPSKKEKRKEKRHNKEVDRHNKQALKTLKKNKFAKRGEIIDYLVRRLQH